MIVVARPVVVKLQNASELVIEPKGEIVGVLFWADCPERMVPGRNGVAGQDGNMARGDHSPRVYGASA